MKKDSLVLFIAAAVVAGGIAITARAMLMPDVQPVVSTKPEEAPVVEVAKTKILVAAKNLNSGELVDGLALRWQEMSQADVEPFYMQRSEVNQASLYGAALRTPLATGEPLLPSMLVRNGEPGFLAAVLRPGMRAVSIPTSAVESSSGLISAGDRVDVILGLDAGQGDVQVGEVRVPYLKAQTIVSNVRVLALNNNTQSLVPVQSGQEKTDGRQRVISFSTVTLEVTQHMAERLAIAKELGSLLLTLRGTSEEGAELASSTSVTSIGQVTNVFQQNKTEAPMIKAYKGRDSENITFTNP